MPAKEVCEDKEPIKNDGVVCSLSGDQCNNAAISCYKKNEENPTKPVIKQTIDICGNSKHTHLGQTIITSLLAAEGSGDSEPDQSRLERMADIPKHSKSEQTEPQAVHMRLSLGGEPSGSTTDKRTRCRTGGLLW
ncbi:hypothetical protein NQ317_007040 [Molorchus minor]|uniref:Uncharacterized protein n=1 Tax=Molorchus minor TaxID=1323400 RepID=A0ABQ9JGI4_9CUCU|nr:hypothetical protein NQ317_007040 [Molorchus minor]